jgi:hypothetical protein
VQRQATDEVATLGQLFLAGAPECFTLEPPTPIPAGTYSLTIRWSPRFSRLMPHVENVPGHAGILIHWGNWAKDTEDCLLVGTISGVDFVGHSVAEFDALYLKIQAALLNGPCTISYLDAEI